jgi:hypothetical protein
VKLCLATHLSLLSMVVMLGASLSACAEEADELTGGRVSKPGDNSGANPDDPNATPAALQCTEKPEGRSYVHFDGKKLEELRLNENVGVNRARQKPYPVMKGEYQRVLGLVPASLEASAGSFDDPPARWFAEAQHSGVSLNAIFDISFEGCTAYTKTAPEYAAAPTAETAKTVCTALIRKAWSRTASPDEIAACTDLAMNKLAAEPDARRRWTYVCSSILSSSQFLTF